MIYLLAILLIVLLCIAFWYFKKDLVAPAVLFIGGFVYCAGWACAYSVDWDLANMRLDTFWVIFGGCLVFLVVSMGVHILLDRLYRVKTATEVSEGEKTPKKKELGLPTLNVPTWLKVVSIIFMILTLFVSIKSVIDITGGNWSDVPSAINSYDRLTKFGSEIVTVPFVVAILRMAATALAYWFVYVFISSLFTRKGKWWKKIDWLSMAVIGINMMISFSNGGRNGAVNLLIAVLVTFVMLYSKKYLVSIRLKPKWILLTIAVLAGFLVLFPKINTILGRKVTNDTDYYLAIYSGAEIKNLDIFLDKRESGNFVNSSNNQTFNSIINTIMKAFHFGTPHKLDLPFQSTTGIDGKKYSLGNVYTTFYQFIYDYGYFGVVWCTALMAAISQLLYEKYRRSVLKNVPNVYIVAYSFVSSSLLLSFFSNKFYEQNFNKALIFNVVIWVALSFLLCAKKGKSLNLSFQRKSGTKNVEKKC